MAEPMLSRQFTRFRRVSMAPGRSLIAMIMMIIMRVTVMMMSMIVRVAVQLVLVRARAEQF